MRTGLSSALVSAYLKRLGLPQHIPVSMTGLTSLIQAHVARIPYGNVDIHTGAAVSTLDPSTSAERLLSGRGGYCFHLAPPFCALLNSIGFEANIYPGQVVNHTSAPPEPAHPNHAVVVVRCLPDAPNEVILADVGIGDGPRSPVPLRPGVFREPPFAYGLEPVGESWRFVHDARGGFAHFDVDVRTAVAAEDFTESHHKLSTLPESIFVQVFMVQRVDDGLIEKLVNRTFKRLTSAGTAETLVESEAQLSALLRDTFELDLSAAERKAIWNGLLHRESQLRGSL